MRLSGLEKLVFDLERDAKKGDATAQNLLGDTYRVGAYAPQDDVKAGRWYEEAAKQGHENAQYELGLMFHEGRGVPQDCLKAYAWLSVAATLGDEFAKKGKDRVSSKMDPESLIKAQEISQEYIAKYGRQK